MARPLRIEFADAVYHVTSRGNGRQKIFLDDQDNLKFLELFGKTLVRFNWVCHAFCLMVNHYHLMIETPDANLSKGMHHLNATFCQAHHKRHDTVGHLLQGRFKAIVVDRESYLLELARYVVLNPVRAGLVARPEDWHWSSYRATAGLSASIPDAVRRSALTKPQAPMPGQPETPETAPLLSTAWLLGQFGPDETIARRRYLDFVSSGIGLDSPWPQLQSQLFLGKETFIEKLKESLPEKTAIKEIPKLQRYANRPQLKEIFADWKTRKKRDEAIVASHVTYGYEQKEIANFLGIHYTTVSHVIKRMGVRS
jgi:putative transposase